MRNSLVNALLNYKTFPEFCVLTGDLGYAALEPLQSELGDRFINAGIAEQNMIGVAAGLAEMGMRPWVYSISPFLYARPFEQIRNDICLQDLAVRLVGSGAGYGYGASGPTHHALEDCGAMSMLQNMTVFIPSFASDMPEVVSLMMEAKHPTYLRLGRDEAPADFERSPFKAYRKLTIGAKCVALALGNIAGSVIEACLGLANGPTIWACGKLPVKREDIPNKLLEDIRHSRGLIIIEDHVAIGGLGQQFISCLLENGVDPIHFIHLYALGYKGDESGTQNFYRMQNGLSTVQIGHVITQFLKKCC